MLSIVFCQLTCTVFDFIFTYCISVLVALFVTKPFGNLTQRLMKKEPRRPLIKSDEKPVVSDLDDTKVDILNDTEKVDPNNNAITDGINGYTNPGLKEVFALNVMNSNIITNKETQRN